MDRFDKAYEAVKSVCGAMIPSTVRAFMLLSRAKAEDRANRNLILSKLDYNEGDQITAGPETARIRANQRRQG